MRVKIIGAGLAGCEAAWQLAKRGIGVDLYEMRPHKLTPAHQGGGFAELVCSNSLRANNIENAVGLLKEEMRRMDSLIMRAADLHSVPAGGALAVDRNLFSAHIEQSLRQLPEVRIINEEVERFSDELTIVAAGPLASAAISKEISSLAGDGLYFHDAIAPIIDASTINMEKAFFASRYGKGDGHDYLNCPMTEQEYLDFYQALTDAEVHPLHDFEKEKVFSGCMPIESMARLGLDTMRFGPMKPVGIELPQGGNAYAIVQLRKENAEASMYNLVGFQTRLKRGEQERVFRMIPGLENVRFLRYGSMHRNTYINSPKLLDGFLRLKTKENLIFAGQISGVEGYVESASSGLYAGLVASALARGMELPRLSEFTTLGSLINYVTTAVGEFQPMNVNFGLIPPLGQKIRNKKEKNGVIAQRALDSLDKSIAAGLLS